MVYIIHTYMVCIYILFTYMLHIYALYIYVLYMYIDMYIYYYIFFSLFILIIGGRVSLMQVILPLLEEKYKLKKINLHYIYTCTE